MGRGLSLLLQGKLNENCSLSALGLMAQLLKLSKLITQKVLVSLFFPSYRERVES